jgi:predicted Na+-dependent transporter
MRHMKGALRFAGKNGAWVVIAGVVLGFLLPVLSDAARPYLSLAIFAFTFGSFLKFDLKSFRAEVVQGRRNVAIVGWATFGIPLLVFALLAIFKPGPDLTQGMLFWALVPSSGACVAFAVILGLNTPLALMTTVIATAASPFYLPPLAAALGGYQLATDPAEMCIRLLVIIGGAWIASLLMKRFATGFVRDNPDAMTGIAVIALFLAGLGSMRGMQAHFLAEPVLTLKLLALAYALLLGFQILGTVLFWPSGRTPALTAGLVSGTRTITLAWVVLGNDVLPMADVFLGCAMVAKYTTPALTRWLIARLNTLPASVVPAAPASGLPGLEVATGDHRPQ